MSSIIKPSYSFRNLPIYRVKSIGKETKNTSVPHSLDFTKQISAVDEAPADGGKYVRSNEEWQNIADALVAISTLPQYLKIENEDKGTTAVSTHESTYDHTAFATTSALGDYLKKIDEDKGSSAVNSHTTTYDHTKFITSLPAIPSDISDLTDTQGIIPPHLYFDPLTITGAGTEADPYSAVGGGDATVFDATEFTGAGTALDPKTIGTIDASKIANLPSGGSSMKYTSIVVDDVVDIFEIDKWSDGTDVLISQGDTVEILIDYGSDITELFDADGVTPSKLMILLMFRQIETLIRTIFFTRDYKNKDYIELSHYDRNRRILRVIITLANNNVFGTVENMTPAGVAYTHTERDRFGTLDGSINSLSSFRIIATTSHATRMFPFGTRIFVKKY